MADPLVKIQWKNNSRPAMNETNLNAMQTNIETYVENNMEEMQRKVDGVISGMPVGSGCDYFGSTAPEDFMFADGSAISRTTYAELFAIIGTTYGAGDGSTTFNLPDKRTRVSVMRQDNDDTFANLGATGGEKKHTLTKAELPNYTLYNQSHSHNVVSLAGYGGQVGNNPGVNGGNNTGSFNYTSGGATIKVDSGGSGTAMNNLQPYLVCNYIIKVQ